jgi:hypothetical protein
MRATIRVMDGLLSLGKAIDPEACDLEAQCLSRSCPTSALLLAAPEWGAKMYGDPRMLAPSLWVVSVVCGRDVSASVTL